VSTGDGILCAINGLDNELELISGLSYKSQKICDLLDTSYCHIDLSLKNITQMTLIFCRIYSRKLMIYTLSRLCYSFLRAPIVSKRRYSILDNLLVDLEILNVVENPSSQEVFIHIRRN